MSGLWLPAAITPACSPMAARCGPLVSTPRASWASSAWWTGTPAVRRALRMPGCPMWPA